MTGDNHPQAVGNSSDSDEFGAIWVSYSSIRDFLKCPRSYYLKNIYKNPQTGRKMQIINPSLSLGQAVHQVLEELSRLPKEKRFDISPLDRFRRIWEGVSGKKGGFLNKKEEERYFERGQAMIERITKNPGPLKKLAVKIKDDLPHFWLSQKDNLILCGKIDWLEYLPDKNGVHIIDFKTGRFSEEEDSLQLPIYYLLAKKCTDCISNLITRKRLHREKLGKSIINNTPHLQILNIYFRRYNKET